MLHLWKNQSLQSQKTFGLASNLLKEKASCWSLGSTALNLRWSHQYAPRRVKFKKAQKGRVPVPTGGSTKGTQLEWGDYGMRLHDRSIRFRAKQLETAEQVIKRILKPIKNACIYTRFTCNIPVCVKGNETRMGKGKGTFEYWAARIPIGKVVFEVGGEGMREELARHALRQAAFHLPGKFELVTRDSPKRLGHTLLNNTQNHSMETTNSKEVDSMST
ncbi:ribosomal protein subunit L16 [Schizosaccharomyces cryophilus OY26]|uniref:Ribosomal protein subunit L16 n=1 Tax=Schizosaccharomyces cryophilus (strain OY26 / ATCC MYA-4695 / CBS 11777 / NBRC 106824 / NRRL Y48691) TaxID=653667 RepID=S9W5C0_SCHCR|nr:ribosomal protein subunit L16 [Schizosaccharomyces cryophilus OY26]EPY53759.1 ribosomal protein subunit L16 [Schizosaccharomyces cryophilus OY26]